VVVVVVAHKQTHHLVLVQELVVYSLALEQRLTLTQSM
jgi:hypothetical protein